MNITSHRFSDLLITRHECITIAFDFEDHKMEAWAPITNGVIETNRILTYFTGLPADQNNLVLGISPELLADIEKKMYELINERNT